MIHEPAAVLALAFGLGIGAQWLGGRLRLPSIVLMLAAGLLVGPALGLIDPSETFDDELLSDMIALGVGLLLFEGGLSLPGPRSAPPPAAWWSASSPSACW